MARYRCPSCGYIYDEAIEGSTFDPTTYRCPICGISGAMFERVDDEPTAPVSSAETVGETDLTYPAEFARLDAGIRHMDNIHAMALDGKPIIAAMGTCLPTPSWDDILILGAQLATLPLASDDLVTTAVTIGPCAKRPMRLDDPILISHMSFGALSAGAKEALARGAAAAHVATCSGEGGILPQEFEAAYRYVFEYVPNRYSVTDDNLSQADAIEIKVGQGTKPGMGGHLPGDKVTPLIAELRGMPVGEDIISPSRFPGIDGPADLHELIDELRQRSQGRPIGVKIAAGHIVDDLAVIVAAGADFVTIDGRGGATGASPLLLRDATSVPTIYALSRARAYLDEHDPEMSLIITGGLRVSSDIAKAIALGADAVALATAPLMALGCQQYRVCNTGRCPVGIATQDLELMKRLDVEAGAARVRNFLTATHADLVTLARCTGHRHLSDFSVADLSTSVDEIAEHTPIPYV